VVGGNRDVGCAALNHAEHRSEDTADGRDFVAVLIACGRQRVIVAKEFVGAVYEMNFQFRSRLQTVPELTINTNLSAVDDCRRTSRLQALFSPSQ
jgi:hypothetical protein